MKPAAKNSAFKCAVCGHPFAGPPKCIFCVAEKKRYCAYIKKIKEHRIKKIENLIIEKHFPKLKKIILYKSRTLHISIKDDYESECMNRFYRSVRIHTADWLSGKNNRLLTSIAAGAFNWVLARNYNRKKLIENIKLRNS